MQRELQQRALDAQELRRLLDQNAPQSDELDQVLQALQQISKAPRYDNAANMASLKQAIDLLHKMELDLGRDLERAIQSDKFLYAEDSEVPNSYKKLVEEYYKSLAKVKKK